MKSLQTALVMALGILAAGCAAAAQPSIAPPVLDDPLAPGPDRTAVLAGGCFWGVQGVFEHLRGVKRVLSGYAGGAAATAHYEEVATGRTGHAESVQITYDPGLVSYGQILQVFFSVAHDPTELNRQGPDTGTQYRSAIFYADAGQQRIAAAYIAQLNRSGAFAAAIATQVDALHGFFPAEGYHQDFLLYHPYNPYIVINDLPKIRAFERTWPKLFAARAVRVSQRARQASGAVMAVDSR